uniref:uroporphyrinogen-III synthase n=1 Tax=Ornithobacterium rhinotracheale TaxID=28251 RepID=UPI0039A48047
MLKILLTKKINAEIYQTALPEAQVDSVDFITTEYLATPLVLAQIKNETNFIVSSARVAKWLMENRIKGDFYCVGEKSEEILSPKNPVQAVANNAENLTKIIIEKYRNKSFCFLCSDIRMDTIPRTLGAAGVPLNEVALYRTRSLAPPLEAPYNAYAFFSPSGVKSFFKTYKIPNNSFIFALGDSTKNSLESFTENRIFTPENPKTQDLIYLIKRTLYAQK